MSKDKKLSIEDRTTSDITTSNNTTIVKIIMWKQSKIEKGNGHECNIKIWPEMYRSEIEIRNFNVIKKNILHGIAIIIIVKQYNTVQWKNI